MLLIESTASTGNVSCLLTVVLEESVTVTVKETAVAAGGVPLKTPEALSVSHAGRFWPLQV